jgi:hypothetical protein
MELALAAVKLMPFDNDSNYKNIKKKWEKEEGLY